MRRRLREEITLLWRTADLRAVAPSPLDEVRTALAFFDETLFGAVPRLLRAADAALDEPLPATGVRARPADAGGSGTRPPRVPAFLRWASWIGGDRDGNPAVTAEITERTLRIHADHVLRGYEAVATRLAQTVAASDAGGRGRAAARHPPRPRRRAPAGARSAAPAAVSRMSRTASGSGSSPSASAGRGRT